MASLRPENSSTDLDQEAIVECLDEGHQNCFPLHRMVPKEETGVASFLKKNPKWDGRGIVIAVLDTGVDPAAPGLQVTTEGLPKILDIQDFSGAGDVDTSTVRTVEESGYLLGLTGRKLKIPPNWNNPSGKYYLGQKDIFDLYPKNLRDRIKKLRKERIWDSSQRFCLADAYRQLSKHEQDLGNAVDKLEDKWAREDLAAQVDLLKAFEKDHNDCGPVADCIVFHDGATWRACVDTSFRGKLASCSLMANYREFREFSKISDDDLLSFSVNIHDNGNVLEIVTTSGSHGTHVSCIAAANFPEDPEKNGVAPGAQIISMCVGDGRIGTMETGASLTRALNKCIELKVDVINYSYGEAAHWPNSGRVIQALEEVVFKHGILFVSAAGNNGPGLSTCGCPGGTTSACLGVGAYLSPEMMASMYSLRENLCPMLYPWSARGPTTDGDIGVSISAPGGAITSVPKWTLKGCQLQNGTSMSSPHATGVVACLMSALKVEQIPWSPLSIRTALENTATLDETHDVFSIGHGLVQIEKAHAYLTKFHRVFPKGLVRYQITVDGKNRGVYLRELHQSQRAREILIAVEPIFQEEYDNEVKVSFCKHFSLTCDVPWVEYPTHLELMNMQRQFNIRVDPKSLRPGETYYAELKAWDSDKEEMGPVWRLSITVVIPETIKDTVGKEKVVCRPADYHRLFLHVPDGADWALLKLRSHDSEKYSRFVLHTVQLTEHRSYRANENYKMITLSENGETTQGFSVIGGRTLEFCLTKWWSSLGDVTISYTIAFHGTVPTEARISMLSCETVKKIEVKSPLIYEEINPSVSLKHLCQPLRPTEYKLKPLGPRDLFQDGRQIYQLLLTYQFSVSKACEVTALFPAISDYLYENELVSQLWMVFTSQKQYIFSGEAYPNRHATKLDKGDYTLMVQFRHEDSIFLEKFKDLTAVIQYKLNTPINLDVYATHQAAFTGGKKFGTATLCPGSRTPIYFTQLTDEKIPNKQVGNGWYLSGVMTLPKDEYGRRVSQYPMEYVLVDINSKKAKGGPTTLTVKSADKEEKTKAQEFQDAMRDLKISWLNKLNCDEANQLYEELAGEFPDHLPLFQARLKKLLEKNSPKNRKSITALAELIRSKIDEDALLRFYGAKNDVTDANGTQKQEMDKKKQALIESIVAKGSSMADEFLSKQVNIPRSFRKGAPTRLETPKKRPIEAEGAGSVSEGINQRATKEGKQPINESSGSEEPDFQIVEEEDRRKQENEGKGVELGSIDNESKQSSTKNSLDVTDDERKERVKLKDLDEIYAELLKWTETSDIKISMFLAKHAVAHRNFGLALKILQKTSEERSSRDLDQMVVELCEQLGWIHVSKYMQNWQLVKFPLGYRLF